MRDHDHEPDETKDHAVTERAEDPHRGLAYRAAAAGRPEVLGHRDVLGLQRTVGNAEVANLAADEEPTSVRDVVTQPGKPLDGDVRSDMESRFGQDFSDVRVHTEGRAGASAKALRAQAYTVGSNIVFDEGNYNPGSDSGRHMLAHELTHVVQQRQGAVDGTAIGDGVSVSDPSDRFEREAVTTADAITSGGPAQAATPAPPTAPNSSVQRLPEEEPEDEDQAQTYVQRSGGQDSATATD